MQRNSIAIVGMGVRGLTLLESIMSEISLHKIELDIYLCDPGNFGEGVHSSEQPKYLLLNTPAGLVSIYPILKENGFNSEGVNLAQWARNKKYRINNCGVIANNNEGRIIEDGDFLPRWVLGEYLSEYFEKIIKSIPTDINIIKINSKINKILYIDSIFYLESDCGNKFHCHYLFMCTGHDISSILKKSSKNNKLKFKSNFIGYPYPVDKLKIIPSNSRVLIQGMGLAAHDTIASLTIGRGGYHMEEQGHLVYKPSGNEPKIYIYSRSSVPYRARGVYDANVFLPTHSIFLAQSEIEKFSISVKNGHHLSYLYDVHPKLLLEMAYRYQSTILGYPLDTKSFFPDNNLLSHMQELLSNDHFSITQNIVEYRQKVYDFIQLDIEQSKLGEVNSPIKSALEAIRYCRSAYRMLLENNILSGSEHHLFLQKYLPEMQRAVYGPPIKRNEELLSLIRAGIIEFLGGGEISVSTKNTKYNISIRDSNGCCLEFDSDYFISAYCPSSDAIVSHDSSVYKELLDQALVQPFIKDGVFIGGINPNYINENLGTKRVWVLGYPTEGANFFTYALPHTFIYSRHQQDADVCAKEFLSQFKESNF